jgi:hypothetical protein
MNRKAREETCDNHAKMFKAKDENRLDGATGIRIHCSKMSKPSKEPTVSMRDLKSVTWQRYRGRKSFARADGTKKISGVVAAAVWKTSTHTKVKFGRKAQNVGRACQGVDIHRSSGKR